MQAAKVVKAVSGRVSKRRLSLFLWAVVRTVIVFGLCFVILYPFIVKVLQMFMSPSDLTDPTVQYIPRTFSVYYIQKMIEMTGFFSAILQSLMLSTFVTVLQTVTCLVAGYGFARFRFRGSGILFALVIFTLLVPPNMLSTPMFMQFRFFGIPSLGLSVDLLDTLVPFAILGITGLGFRNGLYIYLSRQFFRGTPKELEEAAYIDGYGPVQTFLRVMLPNARSIAVIIAVLSFSWQWTDTFYTQTLRPSAAMTLPVAILKNITTMSFAGGYLTSAEVSVIRNCASVFVVVPLLIIFLFAQRHIIQGVERSGLVT